MKTLLLTDVPPSSNLTAGIVTAQMCRFVPKRELAIFCVQNPHLRPEPYPDLSRVPIQTVRKPNELSRHQVGSNSVGAIGATAIEGYRRCWLTPRLVKQAVEFGRHHRVDSLWTVLQGQTMVRMANAVAKGLNVPLRTQVWDPLEWWLRAHGVDRLNRMRDMALFDHAIKSSVICATASWAMMSRYEDTYKTPCVTIIASLNRALGHRPGFQLRGPKVVAIGMAGQFYAYQAWGQLVRALNLAAWQVDGRKVVIRVLGNQRPEGVPDQNLDFLGWKPQEEAVEILAQTCDILYCPYPFEPQMAEVARLSFPSKIPTYLAAGRPILFHGPGYAGPFQYLRKRGAAYLCGDLEAAAIYNGLSHLVENKVFYAAVAKSAQEAFVTDFTLEQMEKDVRRFLGYPEIGVSIQEATRNQGYESQHRL
jgi:glycosyltransferase involved in cell wall biosynthesis